MKNLLFVIILAVMSITTIAQTRIVKGFVIDKDGNLLPGVKVEATNGAESTVTDADGSFQLEVSQWLKSITATYPGMKTYKLNIAKYNSSDDAVIICMKSESGLLNGIFRIYGGIGFSTLSNSIDDIYWYGRSWYNYYPEIRFAGKLGFGYEIQLAPSWFLIPSLEAAWKGCKNEYYNFSFLYLQVPVLVAYKFDLTSKSSLLLKAGPYFSYGLSGRLIFNDPNDPIDIFEDDDRNRYDFGLSVGVEYGFKKYFVGVNYELGLRKFLGDKIDCKNQALYLNLGIKF